MVSSEYKQTYRQKIVRTAHKEREIIEKRRSRQTKFKNEDLAQEIYDRMKSKMEAKELEMLAHKEISAKFIQKYAKPKLPRSK